MKIEDLTGRLVEKGLKVTPQRIAILEAIVRLNNHPTADNIIEYIRKNYPHVSVGTVYKVLDALTDKGLINRVKTDKDIMRYDAVLEKHHHIYSTESDRIEDYVDNDLDDMISAYFQRKHIPGFQIDDIKLQIIGRFLK